MLIILAQLAALTFSGPAHASDQIQTLRKLILETKFSDCTTYEAQAGNIWIESNNRYPYHGDRLSSLSNTAVFTASNHQVEVSDLIIGESTKMTLSLDLFGTSIRTLQIDGNHQDETLSIRCTPANMR